MAEVKLPASGNTILLGTEQEPVVIATPTALMSTNSFVLNPVDMDVTDGHFTMGKVGTILKVEGNTVTAIEDGQNKTVITDAALACKVKSFLATKMQGGVAPEEEAQARDVIADIITDKDFELEAPIARLPGFNPQTQCR